jgi:hypothetical protein
MIMPVPLDISAELMPVYSAAQFAHSRVDPYTREQFSNWISESGPPSLPRFPLDPIDNERLGQLRAEGAVEFGKLISKDKLESIVTYFRNTPCYAAHVPAQSDGVARPVGEVALELLTLGNRLGRLFHDHFGERRLGTPVGVVALQAQFAA